MSATLPTSDVDAGKTGADIRDRLRSAAAIDPRRLPRLARMAEGWAQTMSERFAAVAVDAPTVSFREIEVDGPPEPDGESEKGGEADGFACDLSSGRFVVPGWITLGAQGTELLIAALFGAQPEAEAPLRATSDLDRSLVRLAFGTVAAMASTTFAPLGPLDLTLGDLTSPAAMFAADEDDETPSGGDEKRSDHRFVFFRFDFAIGGQSVDLSVAFPDGYFAPHRRYLGEMPPARVLDKDESWSKAIEESFAMSDMRLDAVLARTRVPLATVATLVVGQTIPLDIGALDLIAVECEDRPLFRARMGRSRENYVVRIEERIDPAEEFIDGILPH